MRILLLFVLIATSLFAFDDPWHQKYQFENRNEAIEKKVASITTTKHKKQKNPFHGWWKMVTKGDLKGFGPSTTRTDDTDSFIFIDTNTEPLITVSRLCGTNQMARECTNLDNNQMGTALYYQPSETELVSAYDQEGPLFDLFHFASWWSFKLQENGTLLASSDSRPEYVGYETVSLLYEKADEPLLMPVDDLSNPVVLATYINNALMCNHNEPQNVHYNDTDYKSATERETIFEKMVTTGITFEVPIRRIRVSKPGPHFVGAITGGFTSDDLVTDIFTEGVSYATTGSTVEIGGFTGKWAALNGVYENGVAVVEEGIVPNPSSTHVDSPGTFQNVFDHFLLRFDSSNQALFPRDSRGWAKEVTGNPFVRVTHTFTPDMQYPAFFAAIRALFYLQYQVSQHQGHVAYIPPGSIFLFDTWQALQNAVSVNAYWGSSEFPGNTLIRTRQSQSVPSGFFNNVTRAERGVTTYNDPFGLTQASGSYFDYNIVLANYIVSPKNLYYAIKGSPQGPLQFDPEELLGYKPLIPGPEKAHFVGALGDIEVIDGKAVPVNPDPEHFDLLGTIEVGSVENAMRNSNAYYIGIIDPKLTCNKKIGYLYWKDEGLVDQSGYIATSAFVPNVAYSAKYGREALSSVFSNFTRYFNEQDCDAVILDVRTNNGGFQYCNFALAEFFGDDRAAYSERWTVRGDDTLSPINFTDPQFSFFNDIQRQNSASFGKFYVRQNEQNYPGSVFKGSPDRSKHVVVLTDHPAASSGDIFPHFFLGENLDGNLGSNTKAVIIGDIDGRLKGGLTLLNPLPVNPSNPFLVDSNNRPFAPLRYRADFAWGIQINGLTDVFYNEQSNLVAPFNAPLQNDWETNVWPAIGLIEQNFPDKLCHLQAPSFDDRSSWRDPWLEEAIYFISAQV